MRVEIALLIVVSEDTCFFLVSHTCATFFSPSIDLTSALMKDNKVISWKLSAS